MELDDLKGKWEEVSEQLEKQQLLTDRLIMELTVTKYKKKLRGIAIPEAFGTVICFATVILVLVNFRTLDTWYLQLSGVFAVLFLSIVPVISFKTIKSLNEVVDSKISMKANLERFATAKKRFVSVQKSGFYMSFIMFFISLLLAGKILNNKDLIVENPQMFLYGLPIGFVFTLLFARFVFKKYKKTISGAETLLKELD